MAHQFTVRIAFLDVGQGDTIVISIPDRQEAVVVDCLDSDLVISYLRHQNIKFMRGLIITHFHLDHYKEAVDLLDDCQKSLYIPCDRFFNYYCISSSRLDQVLRDSDGHSDTLGRLSVTRKQRREVSSCREVREVSSCRK